jgi:hypothetical protein
VTGKRHAADKGRQVQGRASLTLDQPVAGALAMTLTAQIPTSASTIHIANANRPSARFRLAAISAFWLVASVVAMPAQAHDALPTAAKPQGWSYPFSCCSGYDCREVSSKAISERPEGYVIAGTGEVVAYSDKRIKDSPDGEYHWCSVSGANDGKTICLFVPPNSF